MNQIIQKESVPERIYIYFLNFFLYIGFYLITYINKLRLSWSRK